MLYTIIIRLEDGTEIALHCAGLNSLKTTFEKLGTAIGQLVEKYEH